VFLNIEVVSFGARLSKGWSSGAPATPRDRACDEARHPDRDRPLRGDE
jgi:hypothetical protein